MRAHIIWLTLACVALLFLATLIGSRLRDKALRFHRMSTADEAFPRLPSECAGGHTGVRCATATMDKRNGHAGITVSDIPDRQRAGVRVTGLDHADLAAQAGLQDGDVIVAVNGQAITGGHAQAIELIEGSPDEVRVEYERGLLNAPRL
eukprot:176082-Prymnesium_polylepis.1